jgi:hypothetical protein
MGAFMDNRKRFFVFDNGVIRQIEHQPVKSFKVGNNYVAYVSNTGNFKIYYQQETKKVAEKAPSAYLPTNYFMIIAIFDQLSVFANGETVNLSPYITKPSRQAEQPYDYGDSIVAYYDHQKYFNVYYEGKQERLTTWEVKRYKAGDNLVGYIDNGGFFKAYYRGQRYELSNGAPAKIEAGRNILSYIDDYDQLKVFYQGEDYQITNFKPTSFKTGDNLLAYVDQQGTFKVFYEGRSHQLHHSAPKWYAVQENILAFVTPGDRFYVYYKGKKQQLENFDPEEYKIDDDILVYPNLDGRLNVFQSGQLKREASEQIAKSFKLFGNVVVYDVGLSKPKIYHNGKNY